MNALFLSQLKNLTWLYADLVVDVDGETMTVATLIERYKGLAKALADVKSMSEPSAKKESEPSAKPSTKPKAKAKAKTKR